MPIGSADITLNSYIRETSQATSSNMLCVPETEVHASMIFLVGAALFSRGVLDWKQLTTVVHTSNTRILSSVDTSGS